MKPAFCKEDRSAEWGESLQSQPWDSYDLAPGGLNPFPAAGRIQAPELPCVLYARRTPPDEAACIVAPESRGLLINFRSQKYQKTAATRMIARISIGTMKNRGTPMRSRR